MAEISHCSSSPSWVKNTTTQGFTNTWHQGLGVLNVYTPGSVSVFLGVLIV